MKILSLTCNENTRRCILEVEIESEKIVLSFNKINNDNSFQVYQHYQNFDINHRGINPMNQPRRQEDSENDNIKQAKIELSNYLAERLFREYDQLKMLKK